MEGGRENKIGMEGRDDTEIGEGISSVSRYVSLFSRRIYVMLSYFLANEVSDPFSYFSFISRILFVGF